MIRRLRYLFLLSCIGFFLPACNSPKRLDTRISLWHLDKIPYGTKYAFDNLPFIFPEADIRTGNGLPALDQNENPGDTNRTLMMICPRFIPDADQMNSIIRFAAAGNQVFISSLYIADTVMAMLRLKSSYHNSFQSDSSVSWLLDPVNHQWRKYSYPGYGADAYFSSLDTGHCSILGKDQNGNADFIRIPYRNGGGIYLHLDPFVFSNFFLLHGSNKTYYDLALSYLPSKTAVLEWTDFFRYNKQEQEFSSLRFILSNRSLRWAFWLTLLLFLTLFVVESKRKQRAIDRIPAPRNASEDFVKTVGRLYFQQKNNQNLAIKMVTAFLEYIRSAYLLPTSVLDDVFAQKLAFRTGRPVAEVNAILQQIHHIRLTSGLSDQELMDLHQQINQFSKQV